MDLITTHINADFDALSSMVAAKKLFPKARLVFPGSVERAVRGFMSLCKDEVEIYTERECSLRDVDRLIVVDTRLVSRIGKIGTLVGREGVETVVFDHHPRSPEDMKADEDIFDEVGATVTMLVERIKKRRLRLSPLEATILLLGIYEETGSLRFRTTTQKDVDTVSFLLSRGAGLTMVSSYLNLELTDKEIALLVKLIQAVEVHSLSGAKIAISSVMCSEYEGDLGVLANKMMVVGNFNVIFLLAQTPKRIHLIARSQLPEVDVNVIARILGGGGHPSAASAKIRDMELTTAKEKLITLLKEHLRPPIRAKDIMFFPKEIIGSEELLDSTYKILKNSKLSGALVIDSSEVVGIITRHDIEKAVRRGFGYTKVKGIMSRRIISIKPTTPLYEIRTIMLEQDVGQLPVMMHGKLVGVVTRTELLKTLHGVVFAGASDSSGSFSRKQIPQLYTASNVTQKVKSIVPKQILSYLTLIGTIAETMDCKAYIIGGFVRDLLLGVENFDIDIVIEGDAVALGRALAEKTSGTLVYHKKFGTATVVMPDRFKIDLATARLEYYEHPAALPEVEASSLKDDLYRRDFTINAMAVRLKRDGCGELIDFFGGRRDLTRSLIRVLHNSSFVDDPTRIFRAVRFEQRYNFEIEPHTERLIKTAIGAEMFDKTSAQRIRDEIILILSEPQPIKGIRRMAELHELRFIHPSLKLTSSVARLLTSVEDTIHWYKMAFPKKRNLDDWLIYFMALIDRLSFEATEEVCNKFVFTKSQTRRIFSLKKSEGAVLRSLHSKGALKPSKIYKALEPLSYEVMLLMRAKSKTKLAKDRISSFLTHYNGVKLQIKGEDLKRLGFLPGPEFKEILHRTLYAKIDGTLKSKTDELNFVKRFVRNY